jgi:Domain of Unknown Function (DUF1080)
MNRRAAVLAMLALPFGLRHGSLARAAGLQEPWTALFNGRDLTGWDTWLGKLLPGQRGNSPAEFAEPVGLNKDPRGVFSVVDVDGAPAVRISGEAYGGLITRDEYENYHLRFEFKWGEKKWPPREQAVRDSGCCYHSVGPHDASYGFWMKSFEFQIQEGDCGDFYSLAGVIVDAEAVGQDSDNPKSDLVYKKGSPKIIGTTKRIIREPRRAADRRVELHGALLPRSDERSRRQRQGEYGADRPPPPRRRPRGSPHEGPDPASVRSRGSVLPQHRSAANQ